MAVVCRSRSARAALALAATRRSWLAAHRQPALLAALFRCQLVVATPVALWSCVVAQDRQVRQVRCRSHRDRQRLLMVSVVMSQSPVAMLPVLQEAAVAASRFLRARAAGLAVAVHR